MRQVHQRLFVFFAIACVGLMETGCASVQRMAYTQADASAARVLDRTNLRRYADEPASAFKQQQMQTRAPLTYLALSGGGADGAYGAGVLNGWTEAGTRPSFSIVSGVSTGALIAPFAFLGPKYDPMLRQFYTSGIAESLLDDPNPLNAIFGAGLFGNSRLRELMAKYIDGDLLADTAAEYAKGRMLFVVTTNLDSQRSTIWDMGRIASLGTPAALELFRDVVTASVSVPAVFPPMLVDAEANGVHFQEMHVDGGVMAPVLTLPEAYLLRNASMKEKQRLQLYIVINNKVEPDFQLVRNKTIDIAARSSSTMVKTQTRSILYNTYAFASRNNYDFNLTYIEDDQPASPSSGFDTAYMRRLFQYGYERARSGHLWLKSPPSNDWDALPVAGTAATRKLASGR
jgi:predicted acylesterase/phospholipase RssA